LCVLMRSRLGDTMRPIVQLEHPPLRSFGLTVHLLCEINCCTSQKYNYKSSLAVPHVSTIRNVSAALGITLRLRCLSVQTSHSVHPKRKSPPTFSPTCCIPYFTRQFIIRRNTLSCQLSLNHRDDQRVGLGTEEFLCIYFCSSLPNMNIATCNKTLLSLG
jgi:hypothetical protein